MKRALMRGVCALNMEAMSVFRDKTILSDPMKSAKVNQVLETASDSLFQAVIIPQHSNSSQKTVQFAENSECKQESKISRILVTRHQ